VQAAKLIARHLANVLTYFKHRITNAVAEGLNSKLATIRKRACGYCNAERFKIAVHCHCGGLIRASGRPVSRTEKSEGPHFGCGLSATGNPAISCLCRPRCTNGSPGHWTCDDLSFHDGCEDFLCADRGGPDFR
jgi:hypothetical protein